MEPSFSERMDCAPPRKTQTGEMDEAGFLSIPCEGTRVGTTIMRSGCWRVTPGRTASLRTALRWFLVGSPVALLYLALVFRLHRGTAVAAEGEGYY